MAQNPYTLMFGQEPAQLISRAAQMSMVTDSFLAESPSQQIYILTGVRGSGKTVMMTEISRSIARNSNWIVVELNPERDMLTALAAKISSNHSLAEIFNPYRKRLIQKGIADGSRHGHLTFTLPLFDLFVVENSDFPGEINL